MSEPVADRLESWPVVSSTDLHRDQWIVALRRDEIRRPGNDLSGADAETFRRLVLEHPGAVIVLAVDEAERACCLRQYRHPAGGSFIELPAGLRDAEGENPLETARRELREEAELQADDWRPLFDLYPSAGITSERQVIYLARGLSPAGRGDFELTHEEAEMELFWVPVDDLVDGVLAGRITESPIAAAALAYVVLRDRGAL